MFRPSENTITAINSVRTDSFAVYNWLQLTHLDPLWRCTCKWTMTESLVAWFLAPPNHNRKQFKPTIYNTSGFHANVLPFRLMRSIIVNIVRSYLRLLFNDTYSELVSEQCQWKSKCHVAYPEPVVFQWQSSGIPMCLELRPQCTLECHWRKNCW